LQLDLLCLAINSHPALPLTTALGVSKPLLPDVLLPHANWCCPGNTQHNLLLRPTHSAPAPAPPAQGLLLWTPSSCCCCWCCVLVCLTLKVTLLRPRSRASCVPRSTCLGDSVMPAQHSTAQHSTAQHSTAQHSTARHGSRCSKSRSARQGQAGWDVSCDRC